MDGEFLQQFQPVFQKFGEKQIILSALVCLALIGVTFTLARSGIFGSTEVEVIQSLSGDTAENNVVVEIAGAVQKPGVYQLLASDRIERLLIASGGLSKDADRNWIERNLNRASKLKDGQKIYIPSRKDTDKEAGNSGQTTEKSNFQEKINLNTTSLAQLDSLWGIGASRAQMIIDGRPYSSVDELLSKKILPQNIYDKVKDKVTAP